MTDRLTNDMVKIYINSQPAESTGSIFSATNPEPKTPASATVHRNVLTKTSEWMQKTLADHTVKSMALNQKYIGVEDLQLYANWLYTGNVYTMDHKTKNETMTETQAVDDAEFMILVGFWTACIILRDLKGVDEAIDAFVAKMKETQPAKLPGPPVLNWVSELFEDVNSPQSTLPKLIVVVYAAEASEDQLKEILTHTQKEFYIAVATELVKLRYKNKQQIESMNICRFHMHAANEPCESGEKSRKRRRLG